MPDDPPVRKYRYIYQCSNCGLAWYVDDNTEKLLDCQKCKSIMSAWERRFVRVS